MENLLNQFEDEYRGESPDDNITGDDDGDMYMVREIRADADAGMAEKLPCWQGVDRRIYWCNRHPLHIDDSCLSLYEFEGGDKSEWLKSPARPWWPGPPYSLGDKSVFKTYFVYTVKSDDSRDMRNLVQRVVQRGFAPYCSYECHSACPPNDHGECIYNKQLELLKYGKSLQRRVVKSRIEEELVIKDRHTKNVEHYWCSKIRPNSLKHQTAALLGKILGSRGKIKKLVDAKKLSHLHETLVREYI